MYDKQLEPMNYFDRRSNEEDLPVMVNDATQERYKHLDAIYEKFFDENSLNTAKSFSKEERDVKGLHDSSFVYGEITFRSVAYIFEYLKETFGDKILDGNFIDLGSGIGRGVIAAAFLRPFHKCIGIEYLEKLHLIALEIKLNYDSKFEEVSKLYQEYFPSYVSLPEVEIINGDFLNKSWENASILLANSTCFSPELMLSLSLKAELELKVGAIFITFTKRLPNLPADRWELKDGFRRMMSWGIATVYIHRKIK